MRMRSVYLMKKYTFGVWLDIDAEDEDMALSLFVIFQVSTD